MGALRPGAGHPVKRREETVDTEEVREHRDYTHTQTQDSERKHYPVGIKENVTI